MLLLTLSDWTSFIGRFHPLLVHLPIGFLMIIALVELLKGLGKLTVNPETINLILFITAISATLASVAGYLLSLEGGYNEELLEEHKLQGIGLAIFCWIAWISKNSWVTDRVGVNKLLYFPSLALATLLMFAAGHHGGALTHGETYLTDNTPQPLRKWLGMPEKTETKQTTEIPKIQNINEALVYQEIIHPIFKQKCEQCHNSTKMKGQLRMDEIDLLKKGGKHGVIFKANNIEGSEFIKRILLPESEEEHMPPKGKNQITDNELALFKWWIEQGAPFDKKTAQLTIPDPIKPILASLSTGGDLEKAITSNAVVQDKFENEEKLLTQEVAEINEKSIEEYKKTGALIMPFAKNNNYVEISYINNSKLTDKEAGIISNLPEQTLWLKLSDTQITDKTLEEVSKLKNLTRLHLENTKITDNGLNQLKTLQNLEYLNLIGTVITDAGIKYLSSLKSLKKLYLWQTKVTLKGADDLKKALPNLKIDLGISEQQVAEFLKSKPNDISDDLYKKK